MPVDLSFFCSETSRRLREEGRAEGVASAIVHLLERRQVTIPADARDRITSCTDRAILDTWLRRTVDATTIGELFGTGPGSNPATDTPLVVE
ncbi:hypothetical protein [Nocardia sp. BMG51109]|uniref:hypothetical protein n=1 Tax=Nocardia sp. BMG51109 TaxID=1056816 RepID=UPI0004B36FFE|nr:hypothetical protein [Nocardia sp. BMG51109]